MIIGNYYLDSSETEEHSPNIVYLDAGNDVCGEQISLFHYENITKTEKKKRKKSLQDLAKEHQRVPSEENFMVIYKLIYPKILKTVQSYFYSSLKNKHTEEDIQDCCSNVIYRIWEFFYQYDKNKQNYYSINDESNFDIKQLYDKTIDVINSLEEKYKKLLTQREIQQLSYEEICSLNNMKMGSVKNTIHIARKLVQDKIKNKYKEIL